jgi:hypothetical protein
MFVSLDVLTFASHVSEVQKGHPIPKHLFESNCKWLYGSKDGYAIYLDAIIPSFIMSQCRPIVDALLPEGIIIDDQEYSAHFSTLPLLFKGITAILDGACRIPRLAGFFDRHLKMFKTCVDRLDEITQFENLINQISTLRIKSSRAQHILV